MNSVTEVVFNQSEKKVTVVEKYLVKEKTQEYMFKDVKNVAGIRGEKSAHDYDHHLVLNFNNGTKIELNKYSEITETYKSSKDIVRDGQKIAEYLQVPFSRPESSNNDKQNQPIISEAPTISITRP